MSCGFTEFSYWSHIYIYIILTFNQCFRHNVGHKSAKRMRIQEVFGLRCSRVSCLRLLLLYSLSVIDVFTSRTYGLRGETRLVSRGRRIHGTAAYERRSWRPAVRLHALLSERLTCLLKRPKWNVIRSLKYKCFIFLHLHSNALYKTHPHLPESLRLYYVPQ